MYRQLGSAYTANENYQEAQDSYKNALEIISESPNAKIEDRISIKIDYAISLALFSEGIVEQPEQSKDEADRAVKTLDSAEDDLIKNGMMDDLLMAELHYRRALLFLRKDNYEGARERFEDALIIRKKMLGSEHPLTADIYQGLADLYLKKNGKQALAEELEQAEDYYRRAKDIRTRALGAENLETAASLYGLALVCERRAKIDEAQKLYKKALDIRRRELGQQHRLTTETVDRLAGISFEQGDYTMALRYAKEARDNNNAFKHNMVYQESRGKTVDFFEKLQAIDRSISAHPSTKSQKS